MSQPEETESQHSPAIQRPIIPHGTCYCEYLNEPDKNWPQLNREQRFMVRTLHHTANWTHKKISDELGYFLEDVERVCVEPPTRRQDYHGLSETIKAQVKSFMDQDDSHHRIPWEDLRFYLEDLWDCSDSLIVETLTSLGYRRTTAITPSPIDRQELNIRVGFARYCLEKFPKQRDWSEKGDPYVLFTGQAWAHTNPIHPSWKVIHQCQDPVEWDLLQGGGHGWMIWGCFTGNRPGPCFIWPKRHESITADDYIRHIVPLIHKFLNDHPEGIVALDRSEQEFNMKTRLRMSELEIGALRFPSKSFDLNPMLDIFRWMQEHLSSSYDTRRMSLEDVREALYECWYATPPQIMRKATASMKQKFQDVIKHSGMPQDDKLVLFS
ncbi:uncharacterized protein F4807DRAFT_182299 [Annulohypoxylon truncatum]|uniref:uncharacterized protein n=1 Tax=Annulohypoxylon truncatum TaxID=327061 RepID=UPI002008B1BF|nr:uncharacterized protein F4807DRAFT_182299 [Annulohypoxylon truncatum]KAI1207271.1 hypothetical protein F4807DRAFT_182299 [Annulohypoxylon truncatum]